MTAPWLILFGGIVVLALVAIATEVWDVLRDPRRDDTLDVWRPPTWQERRGR